MNEIKALWWCAKCNHACKKTFQTTDDRETLRCNACGEPIVPPGPYVHSYTIAPEDISKLPDGWRELVEGAIGGDEPWT